MFENLTQREKILATVVLSLVPISLIFVGVFWFIGQVNTLGDEEMTLLKSIETENERMLEGAKAAKRQNYYNSLSLPPAVNAASNDYQRWLKAMAKEVDLDVSSVKPVNQGKLIPQLGKPAIGETRMLSVVAQGDLKQLNDFMTRFYSVGLLHRINSIKVTPRTEGTGAKKVRNGQLSIFLGIEILSLAQAENKEDFINESIERLPDQFVGILKRNIFGPANNTPSLSVRDATYETGNKGSVSISADDADKQDLLSFELVESPIEDVVLEHRRPEDRRARLSIPPQPAGTYEFKVRVKDSGFPAKENMETFAVTFSDPPPPPEKKKEDPPPPFNHIEQTRVTGIAKNKEGDWQAWINVRTLNQRYRLKVGESFDLDDKTWVVTGITEDEVRFKAGEKKYVARPNFVERGEFKEVGDS